MNHDFWSLMRNAVDSGDAVDMFDHHDHDPESRKAYMNLIREQNRSALALVRYVLENRDELEKDFDVPQ